MNTTIASQSLAQQAIEILRRTGNPFRNYFARNPDDETCARYHVPELFAGERELLEAFVACYRQNPNTHSEVVPVLGNKGAGKTHLLHSIKHARDGGWQLLVTPGVFQKETDFLEFLLFQIIDTLLGGGEQRGARPMQRIGEALTRQLLTVSLATLTAEERLELFPAPGLGRWTRRLGIGHGQAQERCQWLIDVLQTSAKPIDLALEEAGLNREAAYEFLVRHIERTEPRNTAGLMRRAILRGVIKAYLLREEAELAEFLTYGFAELDFQVRPTRQDLVLALFKVLMECFRQLKVPVVVAFDQLEDLLLARRTDDAHKIAEAFFAGIVRVMHQIDGLCFLIFAERGLWNRFVPSLDGYIQDRLNNPVLIPQRGTIKTLSLNAPGFELVKRVFLARMDPSLQEFEHNQHLPPFFPFSGEQIERIVQTEPTLRDMLQQFRRLFDHIVYTEWAGAGSQTLAEPVQELAAESTLTPTNRLLGELEVEVPARPSQPEAVFHITQVETVVSPDTPADVPEATVFVPEVQTPVSIAATTVSAPSVAKPVAKATPALSDSQMLELWQQEQRSAMRKLEPEGAVAGAARELQSALGSFLETCMEHGVKVGPWRLQHVVREYTFGDHPTYGCISLAHWACKDSQPWKVGVGLFLGRAGGKPKDLEIKLSAMDIEPAIMDHLILLRPEDDLNLTGKSKTLWNDAEKRGKHARLEATHMEHLAMIYSFPRWLSALTEALPAGGQLPNLADMIQDHCERLLEQVCMPVQ